MGLSVINMIVLHIHRCTRLLLEIKVCVCKKPENKNYNISKRHLSYKIVFVIYIILYVYNQKLRYKNLLLH